MRPVAWQFECAAADSSCKSHPRKPVLLVKGDRATAAKEARAKGWETCQKVMGGHRRNSWWCPGCVAWWRENERRRAEANARLQAALDKTSIEGEQA